MAYLRDTAIVLKNEPFREHDARVTLYGRTHGKLSAVARAGRRAGAKALGHLEPFSEVEVMIAIGDAFDKLAVARMTKPRLNLREQLAPLMIFGPLLHAIDVSTQPGVADETIYFLLEEALDVGDRLPEEPSSARGRLLRAAVSFKLLHALGYGPRVDRCGFCESSCDQQAWWQADQAQVVCASCVQSNRIPVYGRHELSALALRLLRVLRERPLKEVLSITAPVIIFETASAFVEACVQQTPVLGERGKV